MFITNITTQQTHTLSTASFKNSPKLGYENGTSRPPTLTSGTICLTLNVVLDPVNILTSRNVSCYILTKSTLNPYGSKSQQQYKSSALARSMFIWNCYFSLHSTCITTECRGVLCSWVNHSREFCWSWSGTHPYLLRSELKISSPSIVAVSFL